MEKKNPIRERPALPIRIALLSSAGLGDIISAAPMLAKLKALYPYSTIRLYTQREGPLAGVPIEGVDEIVTYGPATVWKLLLGKRFDLLCAWGVQAKIFGLHNRFFYRLLIRFFPASQKLVYDRSDLLRLKGKNIVAMKLDLLKKLDCTITPTDYQLFLPFSFERERRKVAAMVSSRVSGARRLVVLHIGAKAGHASRFWPVERWVETVRFLVDTYGASIAFIGTRGEAQETQRVIDRLERPVMNLVDRLTIKETAALIEAGSLLISTNSGPMWVAAALGKPQIALCGPSRYEWDPFNERAVVLRSRIDREDCDPPCDRQSCRHGDGRCMTDISTERLIEAIRTLNW